MIRLRIVDEIDNIEKVKPLLYQCYPSFNIDDDPVLSKDPVQKVIQLEKIAFLVSLQNPTKQYIIAEDGDQLVGFAALNSLAIQHFYSLSWVAVAESHRGQGLGKQIVLEAVRFCKVRSNDVVLSTDIPDFYTRLGFSISNEFKEGWYLMSTHSMRSK
jgi:N-acetylglutamate synthase-like GNAT family acetyltransferase